MEYQLTLPQFQGPLAKLLELIEGEHLEINRVSLATVTDDFLTYLKRIEHEEGFEALAFRERASVLADFIVVASRLVLIKSKSLLPEFELSKEEEEEIHELEERLTLYKLLKPAEKNIALLWASDARFIGRPYFFDIHFMLRDDKGERGSAPFYPPKNVNQQSLRIALTGIIEYLEKTMLESKSLERTMVSIETKIKEILERLKGQAEASFANLSSKNSRAEIIAVFLAILHLAREQTILLEQHESFSDIIVKRSAP